MHNYWLKGFEGVMQNGAIMKTNGIDVASDNPWWTTYEVLHRFSRDNFFGKLQLDWKLSNTFHYCCARVWKMLKKITS